MRNVEKPVLSLPLGFTTDRGMRQAFLHKSVRAPCWTWGAPGQGASRSPHPMAFMSRLDLSLSFFSLVPEVEGRKSRERLGGCCSSINFNSLWRVIIRWNILDSITSAKFKLLVWNWTFQRGPDKMKYWKNLDIIQTPLLVALRNINF